MVLRTATLVSPLALKRGENVRHSAAEPQPKTFLPLITLINPKERTKGFYHRGHRGQRRFELTENLRKKTAPGCVFISVRSKSIHRAGNFWAKPLCRCAESKKSGQPKL